MARHAGSMSNGEPETLIQLLLGYDINGPLSSLVVLSGAAKKWNTPAN